MLLNKFKIIGDISLSGDKSIAHRALLLSSIIKGKHIIENFPNNQDLASTLFILNQYGMEYKLNDDFLEVDSNNMNFKELTINCNESGTTARLMCGYLSGLNINCIIKGSNSLSKRPMSRIVEPLKSFGVDIKSTNGKLPIKINKTKNNRLAFIYNLKIPSAQVKSALIFYALSLNGVSSIKGEIRTRDHLELLLSYLKYPIKVNNNKKITIKGNHQLLDNFHIKLPGDISSASFLIAAALLLDKSKLIIRNIGVNPYRMGFINKLIGMGAKIKLINKRRKYGELVADIKVAYSDELQGTVINSNEVPSMIDEIPIFCVVAAFAKGNTKIKGINELKYKESNRIKAIVENFTAMNGDIEYNKNYLLIKPKNKMYNTSIKSFNDHRIFMSFYIANLVLDRFYSDSLSDKCYNKSFSNFIDLMKEIVHEKI